MMTIRSKILHTASCVPDDLENPKDELCLKELVDDNVIRQELADGLAIEAGKRLNIHIECLPNSD